MIEIIIAYLNQRLNALGVFEVFDLATMHTIEQNGVKKLFPTLYDTKGELKDLTNVDKHKGLLYHRKNGAVKNEKSDTVLSSCGNYYTREYPMKLVAFFPKNVYNTDDNYIEEKVFENISNAIQTNNTRALRQSLKALKVEIVTGDFSSERDKVLDEEIKKWNLKLPTSWGVVSIEYTVSIEASEACFEQWACNDVRETPQFYFAKDFTCAQLTDPTNGLTASQLECILPTIPCSILTDTDLLTPEQEACLIAAFCGCADVTVNINGVLYDTVASGGVLNIPVKSEAGTLIGSKQGTGITLRWEIANIPVTQSDGTETEVDAAQPVICERHVTADFSATPLIANTGDNIVFTDLSVGSPTSWTWLFGDNTTSAVQNPSKSFSTGGTYSVALTSENANDNGGKVRSAYILVYNSAATSLFTRMAAAGSEPGQSDKIIYNRFIQTLVDASQWSLLDRLCIYGVHSQAAALLNWVSASFNPSLVNSPTFTAYRGFTGNGTTSYINTNYNTSTSAVQYQQNNGSWGGVLLLNRLVTEQLGGALAAGSVGNVMQPRNGLGNFSGRMQAASSTDVANASSVGLFSAKRIVSTQYTTWKNGVQQGTGVFASTALVNRNNLELAADSNGVIVQFSANEIFCGYHGSGAINQATLYSALQTLASDLGLSI